MSSSSLGRRPRSAKWITQEIIKGWVAGKGVVGIHIHKLTDLSGTQTSKGGNPFEKVTMGDKSTKMSSIVKTYDPPYSVSSDVYGHITQNIAGWVEEAITIRTNY